MKKLCLLLALALALSTVPAFAAQGDMLLGRGDENTYYYNYGFPMGDTFCMVSGNALYTYRMGETEIVEHPIALRQQEGEASEEIFPFAVDDALYAISLVSDYADDAEFLGATLCRLIPGDEQDYTLEDVAKLDWSGLTEYYDQSSYPVRPENLIGMGGKLVFRAYDESSNYNLYVLDVDSARLERVDAIHDFYSLTPYRDGALLVQSYSYERPAMTQLLVFDPESESVQMLAEMEVDEYSPLDGLADDADTDTVYCARAGEIHPIDLQGGVIAEGVTDMPLETYGNSTAYVMPGSFYLLCNDGLVVRNLDPGERAEKRLKICDSSWEDSVTNAYFKFSNAHGDVSCVLSHDWNEAMNLLENMMNRDDSIDIYVLPSTSNIYDALYRRGYLMELDGSEKLVALAESMYPDLREGISANGRLVAVPVSFSSWSIGVNEQPLNALGYTMDDVPDNWMDLLDFIASLEQPLSENPKIHLFYAGYTAREARNDLFNSLFEDYQHYVNAVDPDLGYNSPLLRALLTRLEQIDFVALGCIEDTGDEDGASVDVLDYDEDAVLFSTSVGRTFGTFYTSYTPLLLGLDADTPMSMVLRADLAFVNPFTKNPDLALAFLEELADNLSLGTRYTLDPTLNEPVRGAQNEQNVADVQEWVANARKALEDADAADRQALEENLQTALNDLEYWENYGWDVSQREIDWFRSHDDSLALDRVNWLYADESGDAWDLISQYLDGAISLDEMLAGVNRKAQMMRLEGN